MKSFRGIEDKYDYYFSEMACDPAQHADLGAILLHEGRSFEGLFSQITGDHVRPNHAA